MCEIFAKGWDGWPLSISGKPAVEMPVTDNKCAFKYARNIPLQPSCAREIILESHHRQEPAVLMPELVLAQLKK